MAVEARQLDAADGVFGIEAAGRALVEVLPPWMQELGLLVEAVEAGRPQAAGPDWQPGVIVRLPFSVRLARGGLMCSQALMATADTAMALACAAVWNGQRPASPIDQTIHFLRPANVDVLADARIVRIGRSTAFGRVALLSAVDNRQIGMVSTAYAML